MTPGRTSRPQLDLAFARRLERTVLERRIYTWPFAITQGFRLDRRPAHLLSVIVQTAAGALHGEDRLDQRVAVGPGAAASLTTQGATAVHRASPGLTASETVAIEVEDGGFLEYLPEPRILFAGAALDQSLDLRCIGDARAIVADAFTVREHHGEPRELRSALTVRRDGNLVLVDRIDVPGDRLADRTAFGTLTLVAPESIDPAELSDALATVPGLYGVASLLPSEAGVGVRLTGRDLRAVRTGLALSRDVLRRRLFGVAPSPRARS